MSKFKPRKSKHCEQLDRNTKWLVFVREKGNCFFCGRKGTEVHEVIPRSQYGHNNCDELFDVRNRVLVCRECHSSEQINNKASILQRMIMLYGYEYKNLELHRRYLINNE